MVFGIVDWLNERLNLNLPNSKKSSMIVKTCFHCTVSYFEDNRRIGDQAVNLRGLLHREKGS